MSGQWITHQQVERYMSARKAGFTQSVSAAKAGLSVRSGRSIERGQRRLPQSRLHDWRTRPDPFAPVWEQELKPLLEQQPHLMAITLLEYLQAKYEGQYPDQLLRTLQRRVKQWKAHYGPDKEVMFTQQHEPGRLGLSDFTQLKGIAITLQGQPFKHLLYHFRLAFSHWSHLKVIQGGESFSALAEGLQEALWRLGGSPVEHRTDSLSAAFKNLSQEAVDDMTQRYQLFCQHYQMQATRNNPGAKHENGSIEAAHGHLKKRIEQALLLRGHSDFTTLEEYQSWLDKVVQQHNRRNATAIEIERKALQPLPTYQSVDYTETVVKVTSASTIHLRRVTYTVPSRLQGETLRVHVYHDRLCCYLGTTPVITLKRSYPPHRCGSARQIDYRHLIHSLIKKPQAFRYLRFRNDLLPSDDYRTIWQHVNSTLSAKDACRFIVGLLYLAATADCEQALAQVVAEQIQQGKPLQLSHLQERFRAKVQPLPVIDVFQHSLMHYNQLIPLHQEAAYA